MGAVISRNGLTDEQRRAIETRGVSIALSAGAGCGKTFVLTRRFLSYLAPDGGDRASAQLHELIAITFTERAAREMRERIRRACSERLQIAAEHEVAHWQRLLRELDQAKITTIHSFCASLLRSNAVEAAIDPGFRVLEGMVADTLRQEAIDDVLRERLARREEPLLRLIVRHGFSRVHEMLGLLLKQRHNLDFTHWSRLPPEQLVAQWTEFRPSILAAAARSIRNSSAAGRVVRILSDYEPDHPLMRTRRAVLLDRLPRLGEQHHVEHDLAEIREHAKVDRGCGKGIWPDEDLYKTYQDAAKQLRETIGKVLEATRFEPAEALPAAEDGLALTALAAAVGDLYERRKAEENGLDFDDLLTRASRLLKSSEHRQVRERLSRQIKLLLVDEFQDTDPVQVDLVAALCDHELTSGKLFFVGDYKQSIYRFRGAQPQVFRELSEQIPAAGRMHLSRNFRSQPAVLEFVNALFADAFSDYQPLVAHREQQLKRPTVEFLWASCESSDAKTSAAEARAQEADWIARRIRGMLDRGEKLVGQSDGAGPAGALRAVEPGDICILFRALSDVECYEKALERYGLEYYLVGGHAFYAQQEVFDLRNLLRAVDCPADTVALAGALRSPFFSLADETLFWLCQHEDGLLGGLRAPSLPEQLPEAEQARVRFAAEVYRELGQLKDRLPVARLIQHALDRTGYDALLLAEFLGVRKLANLHKLIDQARSLDRSGFFGLSDFVTQLSNSVADLPREALAATHPESANVVRLMTVHQSKGLEFPVVFVADLDRRPQPNRDAALFHPALGPLVKPPTDEPACSGHALYAMVAAEEEREEALRLFYVATTRAADYLVLSSAWCPGQSPQNPAMQLLAERFDLATGRFLGSLPEAWSEPKVRVATEAPPVDTPRVASDRRAALAGVISRARQAAKRPPPVPALVAPVPVDGSARRHFSFSRLSPYLDLPVDETTGRIEFEPGTASSDDDGVRAVDLGVLVHAVLAEYPWSAELDLGRRVRRQAEILGGSSEAEIELAEKLLENFRGSSLARQVAKSQRRHAELDFVMAWPPEESTDEARQLAGVIDLLFQDEGRWHVVDYKSNQVAAGAVGQASDVYRMQMLLYALAVEELLGVRPASLRLFFLRPGVEHTIELSDKACREARRKIDEAFSRYSAALTVS